MADTESQVSLPSNKLRYFCSECGQELNTYQGVTIHISKSDSCREAGAKPDVRTSAAVIGEAQAMIDENGLNEPEYDEQDEPEPVRPSMAEQAASAVVPPWAGRLSTVDLDLDDEYEEPERDAPAMSMRGLGATYTVNPEPWLLAAYQAARRDEYMGSFSDWVDDEIAYLFMIQGIKVELLAVRPEVRQEALRRTGLADARA